MEQARNNGISFRGTRFSTLKFADDIAVIEEYSISDNLECHMSLNAKDIDSEKADDRFECLRPKLEAT